MTHPAPHHENEPLDQEQHDAGGRVLSFPGPIGAATDAPEAETGADNDAQVAANGQDVEHVPDSDVEILDEDETTETERVDSQVEKWAEESAWLARIAKGNESAQPVLPTWLRDRSEAEQVAKWVASYYAHVAAYQATRSPLYVLRLMGRSPRGLGRLLAAWGRWVGDTEANEIRRGVAGDRRTGEYMMLSRQHSSRVKARAALTVIVLLPTLVTLGAISVGAIGAWWTLVGSSMLLGLLGRHPDQPLIDRAVLPTKVEKLTSDTVLAALGALGISAINKALAGKADEEIGFTAPIIRDGPGWRAEVNLPRGVIASDVMERRDKLASGLRRPLGCVWPEPMSEEHPGRLVMWVGDQAMNKMPPLSWSLADKGSVNLFKPVPFGADQRSRPIDLNLMFESVLIGAKPRMGKTFALRVLLLAAALDPRAELHVFELKGTGDCSALEQVAHTYGSGADDDTLGRCMSSLRHIANVELIKRAETINHLAKADPKRCPENKVTDELSSDKSLGLHPLVFGLDECQELFTHDEYKKEAAKLSEAIIKRGPALGIMPVLATQRPDAQSLPTGVAANIGIRYCLRVMGQVENDMVLGTSSYQNGLRATTFSAKDKGIGYLVGVHDDAVITRSAYIDGPAAEKIASRARSVRVAAGTLSGHAAGEEVVAEDTTNLLDHLLAVWPADTDAVWSVRLVEALADYRPDLYADWLKVTDEKARAGQLASALKPYKVGTKQLNRDGANKRGVAREAVEKAANR